jgi:P27 family predicted phage terminase small subunit
MLPETAPETLHHEARPWWTEICDELRQRGRLADALPIYARLLAQQLHQYEKATDFLNGEGMVLEVRNDKGELKRQEPAPEFRIQQASIAQILKLAKLLGLDDPVTAPPAAGPAGRNRLSELLAGIARG